MRLLTRVNGVLHVNTAKPGVPYAVLSHDWSSDPDDEVSFNDICSNADITAKPGYKKLDFCLEQAKIDGISHVFIDCCCVDHRSSAEISDAINARWDWYSGATVCYVQLADISLWCMKDFSRSKFLKQCWTIQDLWAPKSVLFFSKEGYRIGYHENLPSWRIPIRWRIDKGLKSLPMRERLARSYQCEATRPEDAVYCLLGGCTEVRMAVDYGEGVDIARARFFEAFEKEHGRKATAELRAEHTDQMHKASGTRCEWICDEEYAVFDDTIASFEIVAEPDVDGLPPLIAKIVAGKPVKGITAEQAAERDVQGRTPLFYMVSSKSGLFQQLIDAGCDVNAVDNNGQTALIAAIAQRTDSEAHIRRLIGHGVDVHIRDAMHHDALEYAIMFDNIDVVNELLKPQTFNDSPETQTLVKEVSRPLQIAAMYGRSDILQILRHGLLLAPPVVDTLLWSCLMAAYEWENEMDCDFAGIVKQLLRTDVFKMNIQTTYLGDTMLHFACRHTSQPTIASHLAQYARECMFGPTLETSNSEGKTALQLACECGNGDAAAMLMMLGAKEDVLTAEQKACISSGMPSPKRSAFPRGPRCMLHCEAPTVCTCAEGESPPRPVSSPRPKMPLPPPSAESPSLDLDLFLDRACGRIWGEEGEDDSSGSDADSCFSEDV